MLRRIFLSLLLLFPLLNLLPAQWGQYRFFIRFTDKAGSPYSISNPSQFLTSRAIARRTNFGIPVTTQDLPVNPRYVDSLVAHGASVFNRSKWHNGVTVSVPDSSTLNAILALPFVAGGVQVHRPSLTPSRDKFETIRPVTAVNKTQGSASTQAFAYGQSYQQIHIMNGDYLHNLGFTGQGMQIALLDNGFRDANLFSVFDSLFAANRILSTWDFVNGEPNVFNDGWHGESVLSCIASWKPDTLIGTAPHASFHLLVSEDDGGENIIEEYNWASAAEYADSVGADIISSSLGYTQFDSTGFVQDHQYQDMDGNTCPSSIAADIAASKGMLVLVSAGNEGWSSWHYISAPSDGDSVLSVAAVGDSGWHAAFSSYGPSADGQVKPNVAAHGEATTVDWGGNIAQLSGTSFACPVLAGASACLWQKHPSKSNMEVFDAIQRSANYFLTPSDSLGYGIPDFGLADQILSFVGLEPGSESALIVYPNPVQDQLRFLLSSSSSSSLNIRILDLSGRSVWEGSGTCDGQRSVVLTLPESLASGTWILQVTSEGKAYSCPFVKP